MSLVRRVLGFLALVGVAVGATVLVRRRFAGADERVDLYFANGSMASFEAGDVEADRFVALARRGLDATRTR